MRRTSSWLAGALLFLAAFAGTAGPDAPDGYAPGSTGLLLCTRQGNPVECMEGAAPSQFPAAVREQVAVLARYDLLGDPGLVDQGEEAYRVFLALLNGGFDVGSGAGDQLPYRFKEYVDRYIPSRIERMYVRLAIADTALDLLRQDPAAGRLWRETDSAVEAEFGRSHPEFSEVVQWKDPDCRVNYISWLVEDLVRNTEYLVPLGRLDEAQRFLMMAEDLLSPVFAGDDLHSLLLLNTMARFVLAGWRDVDDSVKALRYQLDRVLENIGTLRPLVEGDTGSMPSMTLSVAYKALTTGRLGNLLPNLALRQVPFLRPAAHRLFPVVVPEEPVIPTSGSDRQAPEVDDFAYALNLTFSLVPIGTQLAKFLGKSSTSFGKGTAVLLGAGDGCEPREVASIPAFTNVIAVDHSALAVERIGTMERRVGRVRALRPISAIKADIFDVTLPSGGTSLVVANHIMEYLPRAEREAMYGRIQEWLMKGGMFFMNVHLAEGPRFQALVGSYKNVVTESTDAGTRVTVTGIVPARAEAKQVQFFYALPGLVAELTEGGFTSKNGFELTVGGEETPAGLVEAVVVVRKRGE